MNGISLCAGIGGLDLGLHLAVPDYRTVCYVEIEPYPQDILLARMEDGILDRAPIWGNLKRFDASQWRGLVDVVHGGYPCQPFSVAGKRAGADDPRHLWPHVARIVAECQPTYCFFENVAGHLSLGFREVAADLESMGYRVSAGLFTAAEVGAPQRRQRLFILARHARFVADTRRASNERRDDKGGMGSVCSPGESGESEREWARMDTRSGRSDVGHPDHPRLEGRREPKREGPNEWPAWPPGPEERDRWADVLAVRPDLAPAVAYAGRERPWNASRRDGQDPSLGGEGSGDNSSRGGRSSKPAVRRVADGLPHRVDRLKALGNAVVPDVAALAWRTLRCQINAP